METDIRFVPPETAESWLGRYREAVADVERGMKVVHPEARITLRDIEIIPGMQPETQPESNGAAEQLMRQLTGDNSDNCVSYQTEAGHFQQAGYSTVVCGPGDIAQAHQPDEYITAAQLGQGQDVLRDLIARLSTP
jgi:acetylornithine deacetylase